MALKAELLNKQSEVQRVKSSGQGPTKLRRPAGSTAAGVHPSRNKGVEERDRADQEQRQQEAPTLERVSYLELDWKFMMPIVDQAMFKSPLLDTRIMEVGAENASIQHKLQHILKNTPTWWKHLWNHAFDGFVQSRRILEEKAKLYEKLASDRQLLEEDTIGEEQSHYLVDFQQKVVERVRQVPARGRNPLPSHLFPSL